MHSSTRAQSVHLGVLRVLTALAHVRPFYTPFHNLAVLCLMTPVYLLAVVGLIRARREPLAALVAAVVALHLLVIAITHSDWDGRCLLFVLPLIGVLAAKGLAAVRWPRKLLLAIGLAIGLMMILHPALLTGLALQFRVDDAAASDALVLLLGGEHDRPRKAAELYRQGLGCTGPARQ